jgi:hypothetical protein
MRRFAAILALVLGLTLLAAPPVSAAVAAHAENRASGSATAPDNLIGIEARLSEEAVRENVLPAYDLASDDAVAARGGAAAVRAGQAGEAAVRAATNIGPATRITVNGATRIPDGLTGTVLSEVKNVGALSYTQQLRDFAAFARQSGRQFDLYVRPNTQLSGPLQDAVRAGEINLRYIPGP